MKTVPSACLIFCCLFLQSQEPQDMVWVSFDGRDVVAVTQRMKNLPTDFTVEAATMPAAVGKISRKHLPLLTRIFHDHHKRCGGYQVHKNLQEALGVNGKIKRTQRLAAKRGASPYTLDNPDTAQALIAMVEEREVAQNILDFSSFQDRFYNSTHGVNAALWLRDRWAGLTADRADASTETFAHSGFPQPSVILTIQGTQFPNEVVVLGGHLDSTLGFGLGVSPGADDDASGIACLTEVIRVVAESGFRPKRTLKFMGYAGEEHGLLGSKHIAETFKNQNVNVVGVLQLDMTNYHGSNDDIWLMTDYTDGLLTAFTGQLIDTYLPDLTRNTTSCGYGCSDHASWFLEGFPTAMPSESRFGQHNPNLHTSNDTLAAMGGDAQHGVKFARLAASFVAELAKGFIDGSAPNTRGPVSLLTMVDLMNGYGSCPFGCPRDLNNDRLVDSADLGLLYPDWRLDRCLDFVQGGPCL